MQENLTTTIMAHQSVAERSPTNSSMFSSLPASSPVSSDESTVGNGSDYPVDQGDKVKKELISVGLYENYSALVNA